ncbi:MAG: adenylate cyclase, partial [Actinobacteria bacterium]
GIAFGYATCGEVGFEGRSDYAALGTVTNLAARLSDEAAGGQILVSQRLLAEVEENVEAEPVGEYTLKGFSKPVPAFNILALRERAVARG